MGESCPFREEPGIYQRPLPASMSSFQFFLFHSPPGLQRVRSSGAETMLIQKGCLPETERQKGCSVERATWTWQGLLSLHAGEIIRISWIKKIRVESSLKKKKNFFFFFLKGWLSSDIQSFLVRLQLEMPQWGDGEEGRGTVLTQFLFPLHSQIKPFRGNDSFKLYANVKDNFYFVKMHSFVSSFESSPCPAIAMSFL